MEIKYPEVPFKEIPDSHMLIRGTSARFSKEGRLTRKIGLDHRDDSASTTPFYEIPAMASSFNEWQARFEATCHAAVERALVHSDLVHIRGLTQPMHLPVIIVANRPVKSELREVLPRRKMYEEALVGGKVKATFREIEVSKSFLEDYRRPLRIALTRREYAQILLKANSTLKQNGFETIEEASRRPRLFRSEARKETNRKFPLEAISRTENYITAREDAATIAELEWNKETKLMTNRIFGYAHPSVLQETGKHAKNGYTYLVGELVKEVLLRKLYSALEKEHARLAS